MKSWKELSALHKVLFGLAIILMAAIAPEIMLLVDVGGIELAFGFLLIYSKPLMLKFTQACSDLRQQIHIATMALSQSVLFRPRIFTLHCGFCLFSMLITGSVVFSCCFLIPVLAANNWLL